MSSPEPIPQIYEDTIAGYEHANNIQTRTHVDRQGLVGSSAARAALEAGEDPTAQKGWEDGGRGCSDARLLGERSGLAAPVPGGEPDAGSGPEDAAGHRDTDPKADEPDARDARRQNAGAQAGSAGADPAPRALGLGTRYGRARPTGGATFQRFVTSVARAAASGRDAPR